jgi:hypothetical protein
LFIRLVFFWSTGLSSACKKTQELDNKWSNCNTKTGEFFGVNVSMTVLRANVTQKLDFSEEH